MIAQEMRWNKWFLPLIAILFVTACDDAGPLSQSRPLPFPTPGQQDLVVVTTSGPLTSSADEAGKLSGLAVDLATAFAEELNVGVRFLVVPPDRVDDELAAGKAHLAADWRSPPSDGLMKATRPIALTEDLLVQHEASFPLDELSDLRDRTVHVVAGTRQAETMRRLAKEIPGLQIVEETERGIIELVEAVGRRKIELTVIESRLEDIATQFVPSVQVTLEVGAEQPVVWLLGEHPNVELEARLATFIERARRDDTLNRLEDRYFGHTRRLTQADITKFLGQIETVLPKLRKHFHAAQTISGIDWRLIAAVAYHESNWDANATSPTGVRGIMMLTEETADRLGVGNRLDPRESILGGARYINLLKDMLPGEVREPDRTWLALAAYNIGPGHFGAGRRLAELMKADPNVWYEMKDILPLLAQPKYYEKVKSGRARGGEAVLLVENIRAYNDILARHEPAYQAVSAKMESMAGMSGNMPGLKLKR